MINHSPYFNPFPFPRSRTLHIHHALQLHLAPSDGENSEVERLEDLHKRRNVLAAYCKLIVHGVLEMSMAAEVFMYYMKVEVNSLKQ